MPIIAHVWLVSDVVRKQFTQLSWVEETLFLELQKKTDCAQERVVQVGRAAPVN